MESTAELSAEPCGGIVGIRGGQGRDWGFGTGSLDGIHRQMATRLYTWKASGSVESARDSINRMIPLW